MWYIFPPNKSLGIYNAHIQTINTNFTSYYTDLLYYKIQTLEFKKVYTIYNKDIKSDSDDVINSLDFGHSKYILSKENS